jgi:hypothetical protein
VCNRLDQTFIQLRVTRAYIKLLCIPESDHGARMVSLGRVGNYEIRILEISQTHSADAPLFCLELFDHDAQSSLDSCVCRDIKEAVAAFEDFISR